MEDNKELQAQAAENEKVETPEEKKEKQDELQAMLKARRKEIREKNQEASEAIAQGKGILQLEKSIIGRDEEIKELPYDFTALTGLEYTDAMDSDQNAQQIYRITHRQALALFAKAAAKEVDALDWRDIIERISMTDAVEAVYLATLFFSASTRAGRLRISKKS